MERHWFLTWTTYGTWLPGDDRGFVSNVSSPDGIGQRLNEVGSEPTSRMRGLQIMAHKSMKGSPIYLTTEHTLTLFNQFVETANYRKWSLLAVGIMSNHVHLLVGVPGDPEPHTLLRDFKSYGSRSLNNLVGKPASGTWWTEGGSTRKKNDDESVASAIEYTIAQAYPLFIWRADS
jgi:REP element-mobilizing transposase RayT